MEERNSRAKSKAKMVWRVSERTRLFSSTVRTVRNVAAESAAARRMAAATKVVSATVPNSVGSGSRSKNPPANPASLFPVAIDKNHTPIIEPTIRLGASFVTVERPTGLRHNSPIVWRK